MVDLLLPVLAFGTMLAFILFALVSQQKVLARKADPDAPKSTLAADGDPHGRPLDV
ncbi:hypothetical protein [Jannaschia sp. 2305UL9-9]|uniref:hypothetical protein n=1 Tax=Jannaschia sp. 2305UL9-9 TaxID=3121638 RepID=UPI0035274107